MRLAQMGEVGYNTGVNHIVDRGATGIAHGLATTYLGGSYMDYSTLPLFALKVCTKCGEAKPTEQFSKTRSSKDGLRSYCKPCSSALYKAWREENQERRSQYMREWHQANLEHETRYARERYQADEEYRRKVLELQREWRANNLDSARANDVERGRKTDWATAQVRARAVVNRAVGRGDLPPARSMVCDSCDEAQASQWHHHNGYSREHQLDVIALCRACHGKEHWRGNDDQ